MSKRTKQICRLDAFRGRSVNRRNFFILRRLLLILVFAGTLAGSVGCGRHSEDTVGETGQITTGAALDISSHKDSENIQHQLEVLARNAGQWRSTRDADVNKAYNKIYYMISDLDQNGRLEVMGHETLGEEEKEISLGCYEVDASGNGIVEVETAQLGNTFVDDFYCSEAYGLYTAYYDTETGEYHYVTAENFIDDIDADNDWIYGVEDTNYQKITALTLKQGKISKDVLAYQSLIKNEAKKKQYQCYRMDDSRKTEISQMEYSRENVGDAVYADCEKLMVRIPCFSFYHNLEEDTEEQMLHIMEKAYREFSMGYSLGKREMTVSGYKIMIPQYSTMQDVEKQERINRLIYDQVSQSLEHAYDLQDPKLDLDVSISIKYTGQDRVSLLLMASGFREGMAHSLCIGDTVNIDLEQECILSGESILPEQYREKVEEDIMSGVYQEILSGLGIKYHVSFQKQDIKIYQTKDRIGLVIPTDVGVDPYLIYEVDVIMDQYVAYPSSIPYPDVDWTAYRHTLRASEYQSLQEYMPVLLGKTDFIWISETISDDGQETTEEEEVSIYQFLERYCDELELGVQDYSLYRISISDVTQDGKPELVLHFGIYGGFYLILHREGEKFYGIDRAEREFEGLQENGVYLGSGGAYTSYFYQMRFQGGNFTETMIGQRDGKKYYIGDRKVNEKEFEKWEEDNIDEPVCWYTPEALQDGSEESGQ